jgi:V-type H+-transporting ATPase subunit a
MKHSIFTGFFWCPSSREFEIHSALQQLSKRKQSVAPVQIIELEPPENVLTPTYFKINEFTWPFQEIVNTYGIPRYKEVNPGLFAVMFFPFMFGIMFGDIGHGGFLLIGAILLVQNVDKLKGIPELEGLIIARYLFLLMGICALYCGFIYNDFMSLPWNIFGSCFKNVSLLNT